MSFVIARLVNQINMNYDVEHNIDRLTAAVGRACATKAGFDSRPGHTENLENGTCSLSRLVLSVNGWMQGNS